MFPKTGRKFPVGNGSPNATYAVRIAEILRQELGNSHQAYKTLMRWTGANERTVKNWLAGSNGPSGEHLLQLIRSSNAVFDCVLQLSDRNVVVLDRRLSQVHNSLQRTADLLTDILKDCSPNRVNTDL